MRVAIFSDIHSNLAAFEAVLADVDLSRVDSMVSLGDNIGYGPDPQEVLELIHTREIPSIMGNHELGLVEPSCLSWFNEVARRSLEINRELLSPRNLAYLSGLKPAFTESGCRFVHGCPPDSITTYLFEVSERKLNRILSSLEEELCFVGHTHILQLISFDGRTIRHSRLRQGQLRLEEGSKYLVNAGSVGQPRDEDHRAKYLIWDSDSRVLEVHSVAYDIRRTVRGIRTLGLPSINAERLL